MYKPPDQTPEATAKNFNTPGPGVLASAAPEGDFSQVKVDKQSPEPK